MSACVVPCVQDCVRACVCMYVCVLVTLTMFMLMDESLLFTWRSLEKHLDPLGERHKQETETRGKRRGRTLLL